MQLDSTESGDLGAKSEWSRTVKTIPQLPKIDLVCAPTPLYELKNLSAELNGPRIFIKRDDLTGLAFGGNKVRKLEYLMADVVNSGSDYIVTGAFVQSNWCTAVAAAARKLGIGVVLVKEGPDGYNPESCQGNHLLHLLLGAEMSVSSSKHVSEDREKAIKNLQGKGYRPYFLPVGGSNALGAFGYIDGTREIINQARDLGVHVDYLVHASGSGGTQAGTILGSKLFGDDLKVICASTGSRSSFETKKLVNGITQAAIDKFSLYVEVQDEDIEVYDKYVTGYGYVTEEKIEAINLVSRTEGIFLDPVYSAAGMACLIDLARKGAFEKDSVVVFLHTGGQAALFSYSGPLTSAMLGAPLPWTIPPWHPAATE